MKPFDLEAAKRGEPVVTRDGRRTEFIAHFPECSEGCRVIMRIECEAEIKSFYEQGNYNDIEHENPLDLFMAPRKVTRWVNLYENGAAFHHETEEIARRQSDGGAFIAIAIPIEFEV